MKILLTSALSRTGGIVATQLRHFDHQLRLTDLTHGEEGSDSDFVACSLGDDTATDQLVSGIDAIVNVGYEGQNSNDASHMIDYHTRGIYNLLWAASEVGVSRVINLSTLKLMASYEENLAVTETWRSLPLASDTALLSAHLCETVCKEFARDRKSVVANLRLGWPILNGGRDSVRESGSDSALSAVDLGYAIDAALRAELRQWQDIHIQSPTNNQRYLTLKAHDLLFFS